MIRIRAETNVTVNLDNLMSDVLKSSNPRDVLTSMAKAIEGNGNPQWDGWRGSVLHKIKALAVEFGANNDSLF